MVKSKQLCQTQQEKVQKACAKYGVPESTLCGRFHGVCPPSEAHKHQQLLSENQEKVLVDWIKHLDVCQRTPSKNWIYHFLKQNPSIKLGQPSGLDPKWGQCFNQTTVEDHFKLLGEIMEELGIPWENVYNMDEKGCQRGGGR
ncbi:hypothetical protein BDR04DRAFT_1108961, partial [Suillus decipiens]